MSQRVKKKKKKNSQAGRRLCIINIIDKMNLLDTDIFSLGLEIKI